MSATDAGSVASTGARELKRGIILFDPAKKPACANKLVGDQLITDTRSFIKIATFTVPGLPQEMDPFDAFPESEFEELDNAQFDCDKFGLKLRFSKEVWKDNQFPELLRNYGQVLRKRFFDRREIIVTDKHFNNVQTNTAPNGDAYASSSIPLDDEAEEILGATTYSNILDPVDTPSADMMDRMSQMLQYEPDNKGVVNGHQPPFDVFCHRKWFGTWVQIKKSTETFGTPDHSFNYAASLIRNIVPLPYADHEDWTRIQATGENDTANFIWDRDEFDMNELAYDRNNDSMEASATMRIVTDQFHQRGTAYSLAGA